ncbi:MAG: response regulator, partial [Pseudomonadota bacterium]
MSKKSPIADVAADLIEDMPVLRRYARALTGSQDVGDRYAVLVLEKLVATPEIVAGDPSTRIGLFREFHAVWSETGSSERARTGFGESLEERAQWRLEGLEPNTREALLLSALGGFDNDA